MMNGVLYFKGKAHENSKDNNASESQHRWDLHHMLNPGSRSVSCSVSRASQQLKGHNFTYDIPFLLLVLSPINGI